MVSAHAEQVLPKLALVSLILLWRGIIIVSALDEGSGSTFDELAIGGVTFAPCKPSCAAGCKSKGSLNNDPCHCDTACLLYRDCCLDFFAYCLNIGNPGHTEGTTQIAMPMVNQDKMSVRVKPDEATEEDSGRLTPEEITPFDNLTEVGTPDASSENPTFGEEDLTDYFEVNTELQNAIEKGISVYYTETSVESEMATLIECREIISLSGTGTWKMVTKCPQFVPSHLAKWKKPCETDHATLQHYILALESHPGQLLFSNPYCALCHGRLLNDTAITTIKPEFLCGNRTQVAQEKLEKEGIDQFAELLIRHCIPQYTLPALSKRLRCPRFLYQHSCPNDSPPELSTMCEIYTDPRTRSSSKKIYKNIHCAVCNGMPDALQCTDEWLTNYREHHRPGQGVDKLPSFSLLLDFNGVQAVMYKQRTICPKGTYHDLAEDTCLTYQCAKGEVFVEERCVPLNISLVPLLKPTDLIFSFVLLTDISSDVAELVSEMEQFEGDVVIEGNCSLLNSQSYVWSDNSLLDSNETCFNVELKLASKEMTFSKAVEMSMTLAGAAGKVSKLLIFNHRPIAANFSCPAASSLVERQVNLTKDSKTNKVVMVANDSGVMISFNENPTRVVWEASRQKPSFGSFVFEAFAMFCEPLILTCDKILVHPEDYQHVLNQVKVSGYEKLVDAHEYIEIGNRDILVCSSALPNVTVILEEGSAIEGILSVVGISLSMFGLGFTVATYSMFSVLRTVPGVGIMNLSVALFFGQLLFEVAPKASGTEALCILLGALQHYSWLVAFLWMNVLAYDISCTFSNMMTKGSDQTSKSLKLRLYLGYAWFPPALLVVLCVALNLAADVDFDYIDEDICWIKAGTTRVFTFGVPVAVVIALNVAFFTRTALSLRAAMKTAKKARSESDSSARYGVYIKLSSLMGFTWIFGFVAGLTNVDALSYLFIITNSVQGVYICVSFALSTRVRKLYKGKFGLEKGTGGFSKTAATEISGFSKSNG